MSQKSIPNSLPLKVMVDEDQQLVAFAEANASFVDTIFIFLTLPLGTIVKTLRSHKPYPTNGFCINNLYHSVVNLDSNLFQNPGCKKMLLHPVNEAHYDYRRLKVKVDPQHSVPRHYLCKDCRNFSFYAESRCDCEKERVGTPTAYRTSRAFVEESSLFVISDNMQVLPLSTSSILSLLEAQGLETQCNHLKDRVLYFEVYQLLISMLSSNTPLTHLMFRKNSATENVDFNIAYENHSDEENSDKLYSLKLIFKKSDKKLLYAEAGADFVDLIFSFLGFPVGAVVKLLNGKPPTKCFNVLYESIKDLGCQSLIKSQDKLLSPTLSPHFHYNSHLFPVVGQLYAQSYKISGRNMQSVNSSGEKGFLKGSQDDCLQPVNSSMFQYQLQTSHVLNFSF